MYIFQVTIPSAGVAQFPALQGQPQVMTVQNNATHSMRVGDVSVSSTKGIALSASGGSYNFTLGQDYSTRVSEWWVAGTSGDVLDVLVI